MLMRTLTGPQRTHPVTEGGSGSASCQTKAPHPSHSPLLLACCSTPWLIVIPKGFHPLCQVVLSTWIGISERLVRNKSPEKHPVVLVSPRQWAGTDTTTCLSSILHSCEGEAPPGDKE